MFCARCGGILTDKQTIHHDGDKSFHFYCDWKNWQERKEALMKGGQDVDSLQQGSYRPGILSSNRLQKS